MMALKLEQQLKEFCEQHQPPLDLYKRLERVRSSAETIWQEQRLKWFTDHRAVTHSRYIIEHLGCVLEHLQGTSERLNPYELYVLLASCYLHDIGMQDFGSISGRSVEQFNDADYKHIRKNHPKRARELIIKRTLRRDRDEFRIDLDDDPQYLVPIALVSQGHGSSFFIETVKELQKRQDRPGNEYFRGDLLAALLLMGDELDLHERRAAFPQEFTLSPLSLLHHHVHHYIKGVEIIDGRTPKHRRIHLIMEFPSDADEYRVDIRNWITTKLIKQCNLTNPILEATTKGELGWDDHIEIRETTDNYGVRRSLLESAASKRALYELRRELYEAQAVDRSELKKRLEETIRRSSQHCQVVQIIDQENSDWSYLIKWLKEICNCHVFTFIHFAFQQPTGHGSFDILHRFSANLKKLADYTCSNYDKINTSFGQSQSDALESLGRALLMDLQDFTERQPLVLLLERVDAAEIETVKWMTKWLMPELSKQNIKLLVIFTQFDNGTVKNISLEELQTFRLGLFTKDQIIEHLQLETGFSTEQAESEANYLFSLSSGSPIRVLTGLLYRQKQRVNIL